MADDSGDDQEIAMVFAKLIDLVLEVADVPDDGSGLGDPWTSTIPDPDTGEPWYVGVNPDTENEREIDVGDPHGEVSVPAGHAVAFYSEYFGPIAVFGPFGGQMMVDERDAERREFPRTVEDQLIHTFEVAHERAKRCIGIDPDVPEYVIAAANGHTLETATPGMLQYEYEERHIGIDFPAARCQSCEEFVDHRREIDFYRDIETTECSNCNATDSAVGLDDVALGEDADP